VCPEGRESRPGYRGRGWVIGSGTLENGPVRVHLIDPSGDVLPYDHALAAALARRGLDVELVTSRFVHGPPPAPVGYGVTESFYRLATRLGDRAPRRRRAIKLAEHVPDMLRYRRRADSADVRHFQWLPIERIDAYLLPAARPRVLTMHNVIRREAVDLRLADRMDAVIVHTRHGAELLGGGERVHVIPHGAFEHLTHQRTEEPLPAELAAVEGPVVLCFGVIRPYKGVDVVVEAFQEVEGAELWVVGRPLEVSMERLRRLAPPGRVRFVDRYVSDAELPAYFRRADLLVLPHLGVDMSGVLFAGLAFGKAMVMSDVGGFRELVEDHGAGRLVPPGDSRALTATIGELLADPEERRRLEERAVAAAAGPFSWDRIAGQTASLYEQVRS
jgi:glycosyltransferase involved in cell wall biosynthesis